MIYITGDCHGDFKRFNKKNFPEQLEMTKDDFVIICGDFGGVWNKDCESKHEKVQLDWLDSQPFTTLFVSGNHENYDRLDAYLVEEWNDGKIQRIRPSIIHLMRGQVYLIDGKKIFSFGGASSQDIREGILELEDPLYKEKKKELDREYRSYRVNHLSWWERELPSAEEMEEGKRNLREHNNEVDFMVTHCCAASTQILINPTYGKPDCLAKYFEELRQTVRFKKWFFGHYHENRNITAEEIVIYEQIIRIS